MTVDPDVILAGDVGYVYDFGRQLTEADAEWSKAFYTAIADKLFPNHQKLAALPRPLPGDRWSDFLPHSAKQERRLWKNLGIWDLIPKELRPNVEVVYRKAPKLHGAWPPKPEPRAAVNLTTGKWRVYD